MAADVYSRYIDPAKAGSWGRTSTGEFASGIFAIHITYPDTEYGDGIEDWEAGVNTQDWRQGVSLLIRTPLASASATIAEALNVIPIDLKQAKADHNNPNYTYDLGTEEAARFIAAKINSRRIKMKGENDLTKYLRARYVRQSLPEKYEVKEVRYEAQGGGTTTLTVELATRNVNGFPSEMFDNFSLKAESSATSPRIAAGTYSNPTMRHRKSGIYNDYTEVHVVLDSTPTLTGSPSAGTALTNTFTLIGEPAKHTIAITWEKHAPSTNGGYWGAANCGPIVQGMGGIGVHRLIAKPMDGGNMGLPALNYDSRSGITANEHSSNHGFNRFSIEGLNSCLMPLIPPPDRKTKYPTIQGITTLHPDTESDLTSNNRLRIQPQEYGTELSSEGQTVSADDQVALETGDYGQYFTTARTNHYVSTGSNGVHLSHIDNASNKIKHGLNNSSNEAYARPFRVQRDVNAERVNGLQITNEHLVFEPMTVIDDLGNELVLEGGSPLGTIIRDFKVQNAREDPSTGEIVVGPSAPSDTVPPNLRIQLPKQEDIPGGIFVRSGHDRVQAWSNQTWGMGGLTAPDPRKAGEPESVSPNDPSQFETHDRTLVFHCQRILHDGLKAFFGLDLSVEPGAVPSGTTRLFSAHRMSDHAERGSLLKQTNNGVETGNPIPHHRIRFGRQGHSFVMPFCHRGTPMSMRRQLHRSHGSAYSLMFEAETEYKHFGFGNTNSTNSSSAFQLDTIDVKNNSPVYSTGSFSADGLPLDELKGMRLIDADGAYTSATHRSVPDYIFAPGQTHTSVEGTPESVAFALAEIDASIATGAATKLSLQGSTLTANNRFTTASEFMINGFFLNNYLGMGGRPEPIQHVATDFGGNWFVRGYHEGVIRPRVATELATVPPLLAHDPTLLNMGAAPKASHATVPATSWATPPNNENHEDLALTKARNTATGATPDAFLCTWLAEYSHPSFYGTMREHFMTFRYRESGMPRSLNYPSTRGLLLRNHSVNGYHGTTGSPASSLPFERIYVAQWMQNYGYNGLNAGGHGNIEGLRGIGAVLMGHTTRREAHGTIQLYNQNGSARYSRGEGIGDSLNPRSKIGVVKGIDVDSDSEDLNMQFFVLSPYVAVDVSRRLPVRAWGIRSGSSAPNMLAGDPTETQNAHAMAKSGRFDGGKHDSMEDPIAFEESGFTESAFGFDTNTLANQPHNKIARSVPIGFVANDFTAEAHPFERNVRQANERVKPQDEQIGIGSNLGITVNGQLSPYVQAAGSWDYETVENSAYSGDKAKIDNKPMNKGTDPFIDLVQASGNPVYAQQDSAGAMQTGLETNSRFYGTYEFYHLRGNAFHTNAHAAMKRGGASTQLAYPPNGWSTVITSGTSTINDVRPDLISEITETRQIQSRTEPRLGLIMEVESERNDNKDVNYSVSGTRALSLHTDLMLGHHFPVMPSHVVKAHMAKNGFSKDGTGSTSTVPDYSIRPTWSPDSNNSKGSVSAFLPNDTVRTDYKTHALDAWNVRGVSELPAWGGVFILRKTYLNRNESENAPLNTEIDSNTNRATTSHPRRKYVDYIVRPVRPLKLFGFASDLLQDGWTMGARSSMTTTHLNSQSFDRDKRYGVFEMNYSRGVNGVEPITSAGSAFTIDYPDSNEYDVVWHLIPTANMLQFAKADAHRVDDQGFFNPKVEARYSQAQTTGGGEPIYQSETRYASTTGVMGDHARQAKQHKITQSNEAMRYFPRVKVLANKGSGVFLVDDASVLPATGKLFALEHSGIITYSAINDNDLTTTGTLTNLDGVSVSDFTGLELYFTDVSSIPTSAPGTIRYARSPLVKQAIAPTLVDNTVIAMQLVSQAWYYYDETTDVVNKTALNYRGLLHYEPSDFIMATQRPFNIKDGRNRGVIQNKNGLDQIRSDGRIVSANFEPPYVIDSNNIKWRVAEIIREQKNTVMVFKDMSGKSLSDSGMTVGDVIVGQAGYIGIRTSDAAMHLLNDAGGSIAGITITPTSAMHDNSKDIETYLGAHPMLRQINDHSKQYVSRDTRGLNTMEVIRNISQLDGRQIINERNGTIVFSDKVFRQKGIRIGVENGVESIKVSKLFDSPNEIVIVGDVIAGNEIVFIRVRDSEKIRQASAGSEEEVIKTLRQQIPGVKSVSAARKLAKTLLARAENGAPMIFIQGLINATSVQAGDIIEVNLPTQGVIGKFVVFEAKHHYQSLKTDLTVAQYEKGIEGILADLKTNTIDVSGLSASSGDKDIKENLAMSASVAIISVHRVRVRNVNETGFIIGARHKNGLGKIGIRDGNKRGFPIGMSKSRNYVVK